ncbi:unnamed protein product [Didymodactylos carnosus]|uniref:Uncharacterized protein n=1 Tax=Didymodactylos carnosus TaxID=1234261 RepID=A0A815V1J0_9BILA|nr:unnamed protein product [Didymodactylos carnosus]CAF1528560.1 unnamed protein product [Didymodactylos carnosus]CAF3749074.1 unnamed protein product [Didymodactylos carnosus]CAF4387736.1 unnamed protein product [Didymodactylos carnosus]
MKELTATTSVIGTRQLVNQPLSALTTVWTPPYSTLMEQGIPTFDEQSLLSNYSYSSMYKAETLINAHLKRNWNTCWSKIMAISELLIGLISIIIGILIVVFELTLYQTGHGIWTGVTIFIAGIFAFLTLINRRHRFFLVVSFVHILAGLTSTAMIFVSVLGITLKNTTSEVDQTTDIVKLDYGLHGVLIGLGLLEKILCYTFLITIIRHTHKMV